MTQDEFERLEKLFKGEVLCLEERLGERISEVAREGRERGRAMADGLSDMSHRVTAMEARIGLLEGDQRDIRRTQDLQARGSQANVLEQDAIRCELDDVKASLLRMAGTPERDSKAPTTLAAIGEAQAKAARSRWLPIALGVATAVGTLINVLLHK
jgi:hypothetical protein